MYVLTSAYMRPYILLLERHAKQLNSGSTATAGRSSVSMADWAVRVAASATSPTPRTSSTGKRQSLAESLPCTT